MAEEHQELIDAGWKPACQTTEVSEAMPRRVDHEGRGVLVCRQGDEFFAVDEICPHERKSMRYGVVFHGRIICPHHQYAFDLNTGACNRRKCEPVLTYELTVHGQTIYLR